MKYQHVVFDIDGTLTDTYGPVMKALSDTVFDLTGTRYAADTLRPSFGRPGAEGLRMFGVTEIEKGLYLWNDYLTNRYFGEVTLFDGVLPTLKALSETGVSLGVITSKTRAEYEASFAQPYPEAARLLPQVVTIDDTVRGKPDPDPMEAYRKRAGAGEGEVLFIGDTVYDMSCGLSGGADFGLALWGSMDPETVTRATYRFRTPEEILDVLRGNDVNA